MPSPGHPLPIASLSLFGGPRARWRPAFNGLTAHVQAFGSAVALEPTNTSVSLTRSGHKFAIMAATAQRLDVGLKLAGEPTIGRLAAAGTWSSMVTHRVHLTDPAQADDELRR